MQEEEVAKLWNNNAEQWAEHIRAGFDVYRDWFNNPAFADFAGDLSGLDVLDVGCGEGYNTRFFARRGVRITGVDLSAKMIELAQAEESRAPLGIDYLCASMTNLIGVADGSFDAVISTMALMDAADYPAIVHELFRVLRPGGMLAYSILHPCFCYHPQFQFERNEADEVTGIHLGNYFARTAHDETWVFRHPSIPQGSRTFISRYFDRTLTDLINPLCAAGFRLEAIEEPQPTEAACRTHPRLRKYQIVPLLLYMKARKAE